MVMPDTTHRFCPLCGQGLGMRNEGGRMRPSCPDGHYTHWNNPLPVVAAVVEHEDHPQTVLLARNSAWRTPMYALIAGFMEQGESPQEAVLREVAEETALHGEVVGLIGVYEHVRRNEVLIVYHVRARGAVRLSEELVDHRFVPLADCRPWPAGTGHALAAHMLARGLEPRYISLEAFRAGEGLPPQSDRHPGTDPQGQPLP